jgi:phosphatidylserine/phosphatidylglycerophosphate/cardiolipin synthase-like enzyme
MSFKDWLLPRPKPGTAEAWRLERSDATIAAVYLDAPAYFSRIARLISQTTAGDEIILVGWTLELGVDLGAKKKLLAYLTEAVGRKVSVRMLITGNNRNEGSVKTAASSKIDAIVDTQLSEGTTHHQKAAYISLVGKGQKQKTEHLFVGGMDLADGGRLREWFDAQTEITGKGAELGRLSLEERWKSAKENKSYSASFGGSDKSNTVIQLLRTYGSGVASRQYAKAGDFSYAKVLTHAINKTQRFIYLEDQWFETTDKPNPSLQKCLLDAVDRGVHLVVVATRYNEIAQYGQGPPRNALVKYLRDNVKNKNRLHLLQMKLQPSLKSPWRHYVHTKAWIFDDQLAVIGSANFWSASMTTESELGVAIASTAQLSPYKAGPFAFSLRLQMWDRLFSATGQKAGFLHTKKPDFHAELKILKGKNSPLEGIPSNAK